jgi:hypothetical protein
MVRLRNNSGFTIAEVLAASLILFLSLTATQSLKSLNVKSTQRARLNSLVASEHRVLLNLINSIPVIEAQSILIDFPGGCLPHPFDSFQKFKSGSDNCINNPAAGIFDRVKWEELSALFYNYTVTGGRTNPAAGFSGLNTSLDSNYYTNTIRSKLQSNGCLSCHNTGSANGSFASFADVTKPTTIGKNDPEISYLGLGSPMGRRLLLPRMIFKSFRDPNGVHPDLGTVEHKLQFIPYRREITSNAQNNFEWRCQLGSTSGIRYSKLGCVRATCPDVNGEHGVVLTNGSSCQCVNNPSTGKKGQRGCRNYYYWYCGYPSISRATLTGAPETNNPYCTHGIVKPSSITWPDRNTPKACQTRYGLYGQTAANANFTSWECYNPADGTYEQNQSRWEVSFTLESNWSSAQGEPNNLTSSGVLK